MGCREAWERVVTRGVVVLLGALLCAAVPGFAAEDDHPPQAITRAWHDTLGTSVNNSGLENRLELAWNRKLSPATDPLHKDAHVAFGLSHSLTPAYTRLGAWAEVAPLSVFTLRLGVEPSLYFGTFSSFMSFAHYTDAFDVSSRKARTDTASGTAGRVYVSPTLRFKLGPVAAMSSADLEWWRSGVAGPLFFEPGRDTLIDAKHGRLVNMNSLLVVQHALGNGTLSVGATHKLLNVHGARVNRVQEVGAIVAREITGRRFGLTHPTFIAILRYYLDDPSKRHEPAATLAVSFDLWH